MYEYLEVHKKEQERKNEFLPTVQSKLKKRNISSITNAHFINELIKNFYEQPELFEDINFKARVKLVDILDAMKDKDSLLNERHGLDKRIQNLKYYYEYFQKKKYIKIETPEGKMARKNNIVDAYAVLTPLGIEEFLNLDKKDLSDQLDPFLEQYLNEYSFVLEENRKYIKPDSEKIKVVLADLFKEIKPMLKEKYLKYYRDIMKQVESFISLTEEEQSDFKKKMADAEVQYIINKVTKFDYRTRIYSMKFTDNELQEYITSICENRIKLDEDEFVTKTALKIAGAIKNREYSIEGDINTDLESLLKIELSDGAKFEVRTQVVEVTNQYGTFFFRKPTTFHNVYLANGESLKNPSYEKVVKYL